MHVLGMCVIVCVCEEWPEDYRPWEKHRQRQEDLSAGGTEMERWDERRERKRHWKKGLVPAGGQLAREQEKPAEKNKCVCVSVGTLVWTEEDCFHYNISIE